MSNSEINANQESQIEEPTEVEKNLFGFLQSLIREKVLKEKGVSE